MRPFYNLGQRETKRRGRRCTAKAWQNRKTRGPGSDLHASGVLPQSVSSLLTVAFYPGGETEAQGNARVYSVWVAWSAQGRQEAKASRPAPSQMITAGKPVGAEGASLLEMGVGKLLLTLSPGMGDSCSLWWAARGPTH